MLATTTIKQTLAQVRNRLLGSPSVHAIGIGCIQRAGEQTNLPCLKVFVREKIPKRELPPGELLPASLNAPSGENIPLDIEEMEIAQAPLPYVVPRAKSLVLVPGSNVGEVQMKRRPVVGGSSGANANFDIGTIGIVCVGERRGDRFLLSNNHVFAELNSSAIGSRILQPSAVDGGTTLCDVVAWLSNYVKIDFRAGSTNKIDAAIAYVPFGLASNRINWLGRIHRVRSTTEITPLEEVWKVGRTSGLTSGTVLATHATVRLNYAVTGLSKLEAIFEDQILTSAMAAYGDSGSVLVDIDRNGLGLLCGGSRTHTVFNYLSLVETALNIRVAG